MPRIEFDRPLDPGTVNADSYRLQSGSLRPGGTLRYSVVERSLTFTPTVTLRTRLAYVARLASGVRGIDGSVPDQPVEIVFVTGVDDRGRPAPLPEPSFEDDVAPLLGERCGSCHGGTGAAGGLPLASPEDILTAAARDSAQWPGWKIIAVGSPERSYLLYKVMGSPGLIGRRMPPDDPLTFDEASRLERWIESGAGR